MANSATRDMLELGSPPPASQSDLFDQPKLLRRLAKIPKDQKALLDRPESWAESNRNRGYVNVPAGVLAGLREFHFQRIRQAKENLPDSPRNTLDEEEDDDDAPGTPFSNWSKSQEVEMPAKTIEQVSSPHDPEPGMSVETTEDSTYSKQASAPQETTSSEQLSSSKQLSSTKSGVVSQLPARSPLRPTQAALLNVQKWPTFNDFPQSSPNMDDEIEMVPAIPFDGEIPPVNKTAHFIMPTPPSAQVQVPSTFEPDSSAVIQPPPKQKPRQRPMRSLDDVPKAKRISSTTATNMRLLAPPRPVSHPDWLPDSSTDSSVIIPSTNLEPDPSLVTASNDVTTLRSAIQETPKVVSSTFGKSSISESSRNRSMNTQSSPQKRSQELSPHSRQVRHSSPRRSPHTRQEEAANVYTVEPVESEPLIIPAYADIQHPTSNTSQFTAEKHGNPVDGAASIEHNVAAQPAAWSHRLMTDSPFLTYSTAYPSYTGTLDEFIRACVYIDILEQRSYLSSILYDDFIREWAAGFVPFIRDRGKNPDKPMTALKWYNAQTEDLQFQSKIVTKHNLPAILLFYPDEVERSRRDMGTPSSRPRSAPAEESVKSITQQPSAPGIRLKESLDQRAAPKCESPSLPPPARADPPEMHVVSETSLRKWPADLDDSQRSAKRTPHSSQLDSETESIGSLKSGPSESTAHQSAHTLQQSSGSVISKRRDDSSRERSKYRRIDPKKMFRAAQRIKAKRDRDRIVSSSAPVPSTPTSGQKQ